MIDHGQLGAAAHLVRVGMSEDSNNKAGAWNLRTALTRAATYWAEAAPRLVAVGGVLRAVASSLFGWVGTIVLVLAFFIPIALVTFLLFTGTWQPVPLDALKAIWWSLSAPLLGVAWLVVWVAFRCCRAIVRAGFLGATPGPRLLAAACVGGYYRNELASAIWGLAWCAFQFAIAIPVNVARVALSLGGLPVLPPLDSANAAAPAPTPTALVSTIPEKVDSKIISWITEHFFRSVTDQFSEFEKGARAHLNLPVLVVGVIAWLMLAFVFQTLVANQIVSKFHAAVQRFIAQAGAWLRQHRQVSWSNFGFVLILLGGTYLSLASITSLPRLRESARENSAVSVEQLRRELDGLRVSKDEVASYYPDDIRRNPLAPDEALPVHPTSIPASPPAGSGTPPADELVETPTSKNPGNTAKPAVSTAPSGPALAPTTPAPAPPSAENEVANAKRALAAAEGEEANAQLDVRSASSDAVAPERFREAIAKLEAASAKTRDAREALDVAQRQARLPARIADKRLILTSFWDRDLTTFLGLRDSILSDETATQLAVVSAFALENIERHGSHEEVTHFLLLRNWFDQRVSSHRAVLRTCSEKIHGVRAELSNWNSATRGLLGPTNDSESMYEKEGMFLSLTGNALGAFSPSACTWPDSKQMPEQPKLGDSLGPLRFVAAWLLNAASTPLTLIVGLIGFGLLGAMISTFVKERVQLTAGLVTAPVSDVIVSDLAGVLLRGLSAAVVVFLAVQGGLAVLSGSGGDPNPYVLLLACFVAAVFSERVWQSAYGYLVKRLDDNSQPGRPPPPASKPEDQSAPGEPAPTGKVTASG